MPVLYKLGGRKDSEIVIKLKKYRFVYLQYGQEYAKIRSSYQEWRRDWPCEARQPVCKRMYGAKSRQMRVIPHPCALGLPGAFSVV